jgi:hypothetical protein
MTRRVAMTSGMRTSEFYLIVVLLAVGLFGTSHGLVITWPMFLGAGMYALGRGISKMKTK